MYEAIAGKAKDPVAALKTGAGKRVQTMYVDFLRNYLEGKVYKDILVGNLFSKNQGKGIGNANVFKIETESDTLREYENTLPGLAAKRYAVHLNYEEFADGDQLVIFRATHNSVCVQMQPGEEAGIALLWPGKANHPQSEKTAGRRRIYIDTSCQYGGDG